MTSYILDANIVSAILRDEVKVSQQMRVVQANPEHDLIGCPVVYYEIRRGLVKRDAQKQLNRFERLFASFDWRNFEYSDWEKAAELWAARVAVGRPITDNDLLIAVFALNRDAVLVTNNTKDFEHLGVRLEDWTV